jgi:hypothetical protein
MAREEAEAKKIAEEFQAAVDALRANPEFTALQQAGPENKAHGGKLVAINVRRQLKSAFSDVKFSVTSSYDNLSVKWTDGPTTAQVEAITMKYKSGYSDGMSDMYEYVDSPWNTVFGNVKYVENSRRYSVQAMTDAVEPVHKTKGLP